MGIYFCLVERNEIIKIKKSENKIKTKHFN